MRVKIDIYYFIKKIFDQIQSGPVGPIARSIAYPDAPITVFS